VVAHRLDPEKDRENRTALIVRNLGRWWMWSPDHGGMFGSDEEVHLGLAADRPDIIHRRPEEAVGVWCSASPLRSGGDLPVRATPP